MLGLKVDSTDQYNRFIKTVKKEKIIWGLKSKGGWATAPSNEFEDSTVILFWSHKSYAKRLAKEEWETYEPTPIEFNDFIDNWLKGMHEEGYLIGVNWNAHLVGKESEPKDLAGDLLTD